MNSRLTAFAPEFEKLSRLSEGAFCGGISFSDIQIVPSGACNHPIVCPIGHFVEGPAAALRWATIKCRYHINLAILKGNDNRLLVTVNRLIRKAHEELVAEFV